MRCCVPSCRSTAENISISGENAEGITFHSFPSEAHLRAAWLRALGKQDAHLPDSAVVCSQHFLSDEIYVGESGVWEVESGAIPTTVQVCMICLDTESKQFLTRKYKLEDAYAEVTGHPLYDPGNLKQTLCAQCAQRLINFSMFRDKSLRARSLMMDLVEKHELITKRHIKMINRTKNQLKCNFVSTMLGPDHWDLHIVEHTAEDKQPKLEDSVEIVLKNEGYDCMLDDGDMEETNEDDNEESDVVKQELSISYDSIMSDTKVKHNALQSKPAASSPDAKHETRIQELLKCESATYECLLCFEEFHLEHEYNEHMSTHLQKGDGGSKTSQVCDPLTAGNPGCNPPHIIDHKYAIQKLYKDSHPASPTCVAPSPERLATSYDVNLSPAEEADTSEKSERARDVDDGDSDDQASGGDNETNTNVDDFTNRLVNSYNTYNKHKHSRKPTSRWDSQNAESGTKKQFNKSSENSVRTHTGKKSFPCDVCGKTFKLKRLLVKHFKTHTEAKLFTCKSCPYKSKYKSKLMLHKKTHVTEKPHSCNLCEYKCTTRSLLARHMRTHTGEKPYACNLCEYRSAHKAKYVQHMHNHTGEKPYSCKICPYKCSTNFALSIHTRYHTGEKPFSCELCEYKCATKGQLDSHTRTHTREKPYSCKLCKYKCAESGHLALHMRTHTGEKPYSCKLCEYKCAVKSNLVRHMKTHTGEKPYSCKLCEYRCATNSHLAKHVRTHTGEKPYACKLCDYKCTSNSHLAKHVQRHTGEKCYSCKLCKYKCARKDNLMEHMRNHTGEKPFCCEFCAYNCSTRTQFVKHMRVHSV